MIQIDVDRLCDRASEAATLGSMLLSHKVIPAVLERVSADSFFLEEHKRIFEGIVGLWQQNPGGAVDGLLLRSHLEHANELVDVGGLDYLSQVMNTVPHAHNAVYYAQRVAGKQRYRQLVAAAEQIERVLADGGDVDEQIAEVQRFAMSMECERTASGIFDVGRHASQVALDTQNGSTGIPFGFRALDRKVPGANPGDLILVAARPSMGKTALACGMALNMAKCGKRIVFFTLEMSARNLIERMIATSAGVSLSVIKQGPPKDVLDRFYQASLDLEKLPIRIVENATTPERQAAVVQTMKQGDGVDIVFIDYIGLMRSGQRTSNRNDEVSEISRSLKHLAQRYELPVVALSQLNRDCTKRSNQHPQLSDLRDSGSLEQDADVVMFLHRPDYYRRQQDPEAKDLDSTAEILVAKQRNGPVGMVKLSFFEETMGFFDWSNPDTLDCE